ncbi:MAG: PorT family protein [Tannerella sp.]|jgi:hypothetical protein|nr:PorT family protein [Tannerella sp.]
MKEEQDIWEKIIRSKLIDFEVDVEPDNWKKIEARLAGGKVVAFHPYRKYAYTAAAAVAALVIGTLFFMQPDNNSTDRTAKVETEIAKPETTAIEMPSAYGDELKTADELKTVQATVIDKASPKVGEYVGQPIEEDAETSAISRIINNIYNRKIEAKNAVALSVPAPDLKQAIENMSAIGNKPDGEIKNGNKSGREIKDRNKSGINASLTDDIGLVAAVVAAAKAETADAAADVVKPRRWGIGMGGGGYGVSSSSFGALDYGSWPADGEVFISNDKDVYPSYSYGPKIPSVRARTNEIEMPSGVADHKMPISAGLGFSYYLSERWTLQSGLVYTLLRSEWEDGLNASLTKEWKQNLHFIGLPLSAAYRIGDWRRMRFYASAGGMCELNIAGALVRTERQPANPDFSITERDNIRISQPLWSVNSRLGVSYPLWRFLNAYAEAGASYYLDYNSNIKTIRSDKPFCLSLQAGIRFGF